MGMTGGARRYVAVIGAGDATEGENATAEEVGRILAHEGIVIVCGGLGGVMDAAARGCEEEGGTSVGLLPGEHRASGSPHLSVVIATGLGEARNALVVGAADAVIAVGGGFGTLSEIGLARAMDRPVVGLGTWSPTRPVVRKVVIDARDPAEAVALAIASIEGAGSP